MVPPSAIDEPTERSLSGYGIRWVDNHCHLGYDDDPVAQVAAARSAGVVHLIDVGTSVESSIAAVGRARSLAGVSATVGVHPHDAKDGIDGMQAVIADGVTDGTVVAVGECGLDYHYDHSPRDRQRSVFAAHIALAHEWSLPLVIHTREAWDDTFAILDTEGIPDRTVFHCFTGGPDEAAAALARHARLSVSGIVTFPRSEELQRAVADTPLDRLMVETDAPYLAPVPHRGQRNQPAWVTEVGRRVAELHGVAIEEVAAATTATAVRFYGLDGIDAVDGGSPSRP